MSLRLPQPVPPVPDDTARIARAAFPGGNPYVLLRDRLGPVFDDAAFGVCGTRGFGRPSSRIVALRRRGRCRVRGQSGVSRRIN